MGAKMSRRNGRKVAAVMESASTAGEVATPTIEVVATPVMGTENANVDRVAGDGRVDGGNSSTGAIPEPDPPVSEPNLTDSCFGHSVEPADPVPESPMVNAISLNNLSDNTAAAPVTEPPVDQNYSLTNLTISGVDQCQNETVTVVPMPDPPVEILTDDLPFEYERPVDSVPESPVINLALAEHSEPPAAASFVEPPAEPNACNVDFLISEPSEGVPAPQNSNISLNSKKSVRFTDFAQVKEFSGSESFVPTLYSVLVKDPPETVPELPPLNSKETTYFWCYSCCQNSSTNTLPWLLRLRYSKFAMWLRSLFCGSMCCAVIGLIVFV
ncbi:titin homolog [Culex pipiens pallens]|uniref:titin homolog n=1 Tax=Culex pipiens pallens TaxID=42434 RepID=UPI0019533576|nr:titin homolog [Culex pipiens pallens]